MPKPNLIPNPKPNLSETIPKPNLILKLNLRKA